VLAGSVVVGRIIWRRRQCRWGSHGCGRSRARIIADHVIDAAMCGYEYSGLAKILNVFESEQRRIDWNGVPPCSFGRG
jgi:hypothetical protein